MWPDLSRAESTSGSVAVMCSQTPGLLTLTDTTSPPPPPCSFQRSAEYWPCHNICVTAQEECTDENPEGPGPDLVTPPRWRRLSKNCHYRRKLTQIQFKKWLKLKKDNTNIAEWEIDTIWSVQAFSFFWLLWKEAAVLWSYCCYLQVLFI